MFKKPPIRAAGAHLFRVHIGSAGPTHKHYMACTTPAQSRRRCPAIEAGLRQKLPLAVMPRLFHLPFYGSKLAEFRH
jgi:hypothetical protein